MKLECIMIYKVDGKKVTGKVYREARLRKYRQTPKWKAYQKAYRKAYQRTPKYKAYQKAYMKAYYLRVTKPKRQKARKEGR